MTTLLLSKLKRVYLREYYVIKSTVLSIFLLIILFGNTFIIEFMVLHTFRRIKSPIYLAYFLLM